MRDNGVGIPPTLLTHVFDFYRQGQSFVGGTSTGLGIGLALVKVLVELHGGSMRTHNDGIGTGSTFVVRLPVAGRPGRQTPASHSLGPAGWRTGHNPADEAMGDA